MKWAFVNGRIIVGDGRLFERGTVLVEGERITKVTEDSRRCRDCFPGGTDPDARVH
ncbi:MAG: hypothetical protein JRH13_05495 [Deltaproteobacteria bacterium]|nr:hypothetical protein [Deltaproteobacteria bacterium]